MSDFLQVPGPDRRSLEVLIGGDPAGFPVVVHGGSPSAAVPSVILEDVFTAAGLRFITYSRPGYGASTPWGQTEPAYRIADDVRDVAAIIEHLGIDTFLTIGWSGGGPRALACAALMPGRCLGAATLGGVAPIDAPGLDWFDGMAEENKAEYSAAKAGFSAYTAFVEEQLAPMVSVTAAQMIDSLGGLLPPVDREALSQEYAEWLTTTFHRALAHGMAGVRDDGLAAVHPWGFDLGLIRVPVAIWHGGQDAMVPFTHGLWLAENVPFAQPHLLAEEGHLSLLTKLDLVLADLKRLGTVA